MHTRRVKFDLRRGEKYGLLSIMQHFLEIAWKRDTKNKPKYT